MWSIRGKSRQSLRFNILKGLNFLAFVAVIIKKVAVFSQITAFLLNLGNQP